jgi:hypothetical protein
MMVEKTIAAPAGKLGDFILSINSIDTRSMTDLALAKLFVDTASEKDRTLVVLRHSSSYVSTSGVVPITTVK